MADNLEDFLDANTAKWRIVEQPGQTEPSTEALPTLSPPAPPRSRREMRRRQEKHRRRHIVAAFIVVLMIAVLSGGGYMGYRALKGWSAAQSQTSAALADYPGPGSGQVQFTVTSGEGINAIADGLVKAGIIKGAGAFSTAVSANGSTLYPGTFMLKKQMASVDVVKILSDQTKAGGFLQVKSGQRVTDIITSAATISGIPLADFKSVIQSGSSGILPAEANGKFEGWFEPGSYNVKAQKSASDIIKALVDARMKKLDALGVPAGSQRERILTISSIAESEVNSQNYYGKVARVILNRLATNMNLGMDSTVAYGLGISPSNLTNAMLADTSNAYNTRVHSGLPPTPISNPGDLAITAALNPPSGDWLYFVTTNLKTGETKFASTEGEFWKLRNEYKSSNPNAN